MINEKCIYMAVLHIKFTIVFTTLYYLTRVHAYIVFKSFYGNRFNQDKALNYIT